MLLVHIQFNMQDSSNVLLHNQLWSATTLQMVAEGQELLEEILSVVSSVQIFSKQYT